MTFSYQIKYLSNTNTKNLAQNMFRIGRVFNIYHLSTKEMCISDKLNIQLIRNVIDFLENGLNKYDFGNEYKQFLLNYLQQLKTLEFIFSSDSYYDMICIFYTKLVTKELYIRLINNLQEYHSILKVIDGPKLKLVFNNENSYSFKNVRTMKDIFGNTYLNSSLLNLEKVYYFPQSIKNKNFIAKTIYSLSQLKGVENLNYLHLENPYNTLKTYSYRNLSPDCSDFHSSTKNIQDYLGLQLGYILQG